MIFILVVSASEWGKSWENVLTLDLAGLKLWPIGISANHR